MTKVYLARNQELSEVQQPFLHRSAFDRTASPRRIVARTEAHAYQQLSDSVVRQKPMVPEFDRDYSKPVGLVLIALAIGIGLAKWWGWLVTFVFMDLK